jgi:hypothetical protein
MAKKLLHVDDGKKGGPFARADDFVLLSLQ